MILSTARIFLVLQSFLFYIILLNDKATEACICLLNYNLQRSFYESTDVVQVRVIGAVFDGKGFDRQRIHVAEVKKTFKGKPKIGEYILITSSSNNSCGVKLENRRWYLMNLRKNDVNDTRKGGLGVYTTDLCDYNMRWKYVEKKDRQFLNTRAICDEKGESCKCADGSEQVQCLIDPCETTKCDQGTVCTANYCGGCKAEWTDDMGISMCT